MNDSMIPIPIFMDITVQYQDTPLDTTRHDTTRHTYGFVPKKIGGFGRVADSRFQQKKPYAVFGLSVAAACFVFGCSR
jgi:hypothetical protein